MYHPCVQGLVPLNSSVPQFLQPLIIDTAHSMHSCAVFLTHEGLQSQTYPQGCQWQEVPDSKCDGKESAKDNVLMGSRNILQDSCEIGRLLSWCPLRPLPSWGVLFLGNTRLEVLAGRHFLRHRTCGPLTPGPQVLPICAGSQVLAHKGAVCKPCISAPHMSAHSRPVLPTGFPSRKTREF